jgi:hypothetical protein
MNTNARHDSFTGEGTKSMKLSRRGGIYVDVLDPAQQTYSIPDNGEGKIKVAPQTALILVPQDMVKP